MTNGDKIRKEINEMSDEELASFLFMHSYCCQMCIFFSQNRHCWEYGCHEGIIEWVKRKSRKKRILE